MGNPENSLDRADLLYYFKRNPAAFVQLVLSELRPKDYYRLMWFHRDWIELPFERVDGGIIPRVVHFETEVTAPRGFLKSTLLILTHFIWWPLIGAEYLERGIQPTGILVCDSEAKMKEFGKLVADALMTPTLRGLLGYEFSRRSDFKQNQGDHQIILPCCSLPWAPEIQPQQEAAIRIKPVGSTPTGMHMAGGTLMFDDAAVSQSAKSPKKTAPRRSMIDDYKALADPAMILHSDTRYTSEDYGIEELETNPAVAHNWPPWTEKSSRSAFADDEMTTAIWPEVRGMEWLRSKRSSMTESNFRAQYCNDLTALSGVIFSPSLITRITVDEKSDIVKRLRQDNPQRVYGIDMAYGGEDYTAVVAAYYFADRIWLEDVLYHSYSSDEAAKKYCDVVNVTRHYDSYVEANGPQKANIDILRREGHPAIDGYYPRGDKVQRAEPLLAAMQGDAVRIIDSGQLAARLMEFTGLDGDKDDMVDAAVIAWDRLYTPNKGKLVFGGAAWSPEEAKKPQFHYTFGGR
jgi:hypothetical protein